MDTNSASRIARQTCRVADFRVGIPLKSTGAPRVGKPAAQQTGKSALRLALALLLVIALSPVLSVFAADAQPSEPSSPRDFYNDGTGKFRSGKLPDAEAELESAVAGQDETVQEQALYNLGHVRFQEGVELLKKGPDAKAAQAAASRANAVGDAAIHAADDALAGSDVNDLVAAYMQGRGARKELKAAIDAVKRALDSHGAVLAKWRRASGDFKSAHELRPPDTDSAFNADVVDRHIARLVDEQRMLMAAMAALQAQRQALGQKMGKMKNKIPGQQGQQMQGEGDDSDDEDEDKPPQGPQPGTVEGPVKSGREMAMSAEEAERLLGMLRLDANRKLPLGDKEGPPPKDRKRRDW
jgi:hypothetical protein